MFRTRQELFDNAFKGVIDQGRPAYDDAADSCMYRGPDGTKCGIGHSIPNSKYRKSMENRGASADLVLTAARIAEEDSAFAVQLQGCHDNAAHEALSTKDFIARFTRRMKILARQEGLEVPNV